jgi:cyclophilin family peptidyl-prolyl cis-trans isomerase/HEAT repeat protein
MSAASWLRSLIPSACRAAALLAVLAAAPAARAQDPAVVEVLAFVLQAEDARQYNGPVLTSGARHADPLVRRVAALAIGRIGDPAGTTLLLELLQDPDSTVQREAAFALGLLGDTAAVPQLRDLVINTVPERQHDLHGEAASALTRLGGAAAADVIRTLLSPWVARAATTAPPPAVEAALEDAWRLGRPLAPTEQLVEFVVSPSHRARIGATYSLARLREPRAAEVLLTATDNPETEMRLNAVRALTAAYADSAGLDRLALASRVRRLVGDQDAHVRTIALRTLATYHDSSLVPAVKDRLADADPNVRVQAVATLGDLGGSEAEAALRSQVRRQPFALRRQALISLARVGGVRSLDAVAEWLGSQDWTYRMAGAEALGYITADTVVPWLTYLTQDQDPRVVAVALASLTAVGPDTATVWARQLITHRDAVVRSIAADRLGAAANPADIGRLVEGYRLAERDSISDARIAILGALGSISERGFAERVAVEDEFLARVQPSPDYLVRRAAAERFPEAARRWGPALPIQTGRGIEDYRDMARRFVAPGAVGTQTVVMDTDRGRIVLDLFARDAPLTVTALLQLVDQRVFDNLLWHRVVPGFVVQTGDPRADGWGGPGFALRDEINRFHYLRGTVGMALSGPDTGGSQFFITLATQPHLDGTYTVVGRVLSGMEVLDLITQGDRIRTVRRQ